MTTDISQIKESIDHLFKIRDGILSKIRPYKNEPNYGSLIQESFATEEHETQIEADKVNKYLNGNYSCIVSVSNKIASLKNTVREFDGSEVFNSVSNSNIFIYLKLPQIDSELIIKNNISTQINQEENKDGNYTFLKVLDGYARFYTEDNKFVDYFRNNQHINIVKSNELEAILTIPATDISLENFLIKMCDFSKEHITTCYKNPFFQEGIWKILVNNYSIMNETLKVADFIKDNYIEAIKNKTVPKHLNAVQYGKAENMWCDFIEESEKAVLNLTLNKKLSQNKPLIKTAKI